MRKVDAGAVLPEPEDSPYLPLSVDLAIDLVDEARFSIPTFPLPPIYSHIPPHPSLQAIDLVDEAAAKLKMEITSKPEALDVIDRQVCVGERKCGI